MTDESSDHQTGHGMASGERSRQEAREAAHEYAQQTTDEQGAPLPKVDLSTFVLSLSSSALVHLGEVPEPESGEIRQNLGLARHTIDIIGMLEEKTRGNVTEDEAGLFRNLLFDLRMKYVQKVK
jgi:hypothetical protein